MTADDTREALPPGPYRLVGPDHQGGLFEVWGHQGTPPDFTDGWAIPFVAKGPQGAMEWLLAALAAARRDPEPVASVDAAWEALIEAAEFLPIGTAIARHRPAIEAAIRGTEPVASAALRETVEAVIRRDFGACYPDGARFYTTADRVLAAIRGTEAGREPLAEAVITALDVYGTMGNGEGWTLDADVIGTLWIALTPEEKARTGYDVAAMNEHHASADSEPSLLDEAEREPS